MRVIAASAGASGSQGSRLAGIDVLRGLCVLLVLLNHIELRFLLNDLPVRLVFRGLSQQLDEILLPDRGVGMRAVAIGMHGRRDQDVTPVR